MQIKSHNNVPLLQLASCFNGDATKQKQYPKGDISHKVTALKCAYLADYSYEKHRKVQGRLTLCQQSSIFIS